MTTISCAEKCIYQSNGYCELDSAAAVTNLVGSGCMHKVEPEKNSSAPGKSSHSITDGSDSDHLNLSIIG